MKAVNRIKANQDFAKTIKNGKTRKNSSFVLHMVNESDSKHTRIGLSVSKKIGNAVTRNRIKRQVRAMCDQIIDYSCTHFDAVIIVRKDFLLKSYSDNIGLLNELLGEQ